MARRKQTNPFTNRKANVSLHRNGLQIEIADVSAVDAGIVAKELLDMMRQLTAAGYDELTLDAGGAHGGALGEVPEDEYEEDFALPPEAKRRHIGFTG